MNHLHSVNCLPILSKPDLQCAYIQPAEGPDHCPCSSTAGTRQAGPRTMDMQFAKVKPGDSLANEHCQRKSVCFVLWKFDKKPTWFPFFFQMIYILGTCQVLFGEFFPPKPPPLLGQFFCIRNFYGQYANLS